MGSIDKIRKQGFSSFAQLYSEGVGVICHAAAGAPFTRTFAIALGGPVRRLERHLDERRCDDAKRLSRRSFLASKNADI